MESVLDEEHPRYYLQSLHSYTFAPLSTAADRVDQECTELAAEQEAFKLLYDRVEQIEPEQSSNMSVSSAKVREQSHTADKMEQVSTAYRETVMEVPHYDDVYGETFVEHLAREFGPEFAAQVGHAGTFYSKWFKSVFQGKVESAIHSRQKLLKTINEEAQSIAAAENSLKSLSAQLDTTIIPDWYREDFTSELDTIVEERQKTLQNRASEPHLKDHTLCTYLYDEQSWTYPILTAVARVREAVTIDTYHGRGYATGD